MLADLPENLITPIGIGDSELRDAVAAYLAKHTPPPLEPSSQGRIDQVDHQETLQLGILCASPPPPHATSLAMREECDVARFTVASINNRSERLIDCSASSTTECSPFGRGSRLSRHRTPRAVMAVSARHLRRCVRSCLRWQL